MSTRLSVAASILCALALAFLAGCAASSRTNESRAPAASAAHRELGGEPRARRALEFSKDSRDESAGRVAGRGAKAGDFDSVIHAGLAPEATVGRPGPIDAGRPARIGPAGGGAVTWKRASARPNATRLEVGDGDELPLAAVQFSVRVDGFRARVMMDCFYHNDRPRQLEGTFRVRLPEGASPCYLAFGNTSYAARDVAAGRAGVIAREDSGRGFSPDEVIRVRRGGWEDVREARMVPRGKAATAYRETVHRRVDPAIMEWSGAGVFSARVYPLFPRTVSRVVVGYDLNLVPAGDGLELRLDLPAKVPNCVVDLDVAAPRGLAVSVEPESHPAAAPGRELYRIENPKAGTVTLRLGRAGNVLLAGSDPAAGELFAATLRPELPAGEAAGAPTRAVFMLDTSLSSQPEKFNVYLKLLESILSANRDSLREFAVLAFDVSPRWWRRNWTPNTPETAGELLAWAGNLSLEGATDLSAALRQAASPDWLSGPGADSARDLFLLGDGAASWGASDTASLAALVRGGRGGALWTYRTGLAGTATETLAALARASGGAVFSVTGEAEVAAAARAHRSPPWRIESLKLAGGTDLLLAGRPESVFPGQRLALAGRGRPAENAVCELELSRGGERRTVRTGLQPAIESPLAARCYGQIAVGQMEELLPAGEDLARHYAAHFRVTGQTCSLLMLESEADYARFGLVPVDDGAAVRKSPAAPAVAEALAAAEARPFDARAAFMAMIGRLDAVRGAPSLSAPVREMLASLPAEAFAVETERMLVRGLARSGLSAGYLKVLAAAEPDGEAVWAEAQRRIEHFGPADALRALSSLVESRPGDQVAARDVGLGALGWNLPGHAYHVFAALTSARPADGHNYRAMAACLHDLGRADLAMACYELAISAPPNARGDYARTVALDYLRLLHAVEDGRLRSSGAWFARERLKELSRMHDLGELDLLVSLTWNTDATDVDLQVVEPTGQTCSARTPRTRSGGALGANVTDGFGPELYTVKRAPAGDYRIRARYRSSDRNRTAVPTRVFATIVTGWGTDWERAHRRTVLLERAGNLQNVATVRFDGRKG